MEEERLLEQIIRDISYGTLYLLDLLAQGSPEPQTSELLQELEQHAQDYERVEEMCLDNIRVTRKRDRLRKC